MLSYDWSQVKHRLDFQLLLKKREIEDERLLKIVNDIDCEDHYCMMLSAIDDGINSLFTFPCEFVSEISEEMREEFEEDCEYYVNCIFHIPGLLPYVEHPSFLEFIRKISYYVQGDYNDIVEFAYLPISDYSAPRAEAHQKEFADQPGTFIIGSHMECGFAPSDVLDFLEFMKKFSDHINKLIA